MKITLFNYWRSSASWRVRIALAAKNIPYEYQVVNIVDGDQKLPQYLDVHPAGLVPCLKVVGFRKDPIIITQSLAILDFLDNIDGKPIFTPKDMYERTKMLEIVNTIVCDTHPLQNFTVLQTYPNGTRKERAHTVITKSFRAIESLLERHDSEVKANRYAMGDKLTIADMTLIPQVYNAITRFGVKLEDYPRIKNIYEYAVEQPSFIVSHPDCQPDAPKK